MAQIIDLEDGLPAAPAGFQNGTWQKGAQTGTDAATGLPIFPASVNIPAAGGVNEQTANYTLQASDCGKLVVINSASAVTVTLPAAIPFAKWSCRVANIGAGAVTLAPGGSLDIDGGTAAITLAQWQSCYVATDGTNWFSGRGAGSGGGVGMVNPMTAVGDLIVGGAVTGGVASPGRLAAGTTGYVLKSNGAGAAPSWQASSAGYPVGTIPTVVQVGFSTGGGNTVTLAAAPTNGNLLVAYCCNPTSAASGTGWTNYSPVLNSLGTDFGVLLYKVASGDGTTLTPISGVGATGGIVVWEIQSALGTASLLAGTSQGESTAVTTTNQSFLPNVANCLGLSALMSIPSPTIVTGFNVGTQDVKTNSGTRFILAGHTDLSQTPMVGLFALMSASASFKVMSVLVSS